MTSSYHLGGECSDECKKYSLNVPKLRFKGYNEEWKQNKLGNLFEIKAGGDIDNKKLSKNKNEQYKYPVYANALQNNGLYGYSDIYKISGETITVTGRGDVGHAIARKENYYPIVRLLILKPIVKQDVDFWANAINNTRIFVESTGVPQLTAPQLAKIKIYYPSLPEQEKIAAFLTLIDKKIEKQKELVELLKKYKRGLLSQIFSQKLRFKDDNGNNYPNWEEKYIQDVCSITTGKGNTQDKEENGVYPFYVRSPIIEKSNKYIFDGEAVLTVGDGVGTGKVFHYVNGKFNFHQRVYKMSNFSGINGRYFYYYFSTHFYDRVKRMTAKTSVDSVRMDMIAKMPIFIPTNAEQDKIINLLTNVENIFLKNENLLLLLQEYKKGLLQQMFI